MCSVLQWVGCIAIIDLTIIDYLYHMSLVVRKPDFCKCKDADQLRGNRKADQRLCFRYMDSTIPLLPKSEISSILCSCTARFVLALVGNPEDRFSHIKAHHVNIFVLV